MPSWISYSNCWNPIFYRGQIYVCGPLKYLNDKQRDRKKSGRDGGLYKQRLQQHCYSEGFLFTHHVKAVNVESVTQHIAIQVQPNINENVPCCVNPKFHRKDLKSCMNIALTWNSMWLIPTNDQLDALFHVFIYFISLYVSSITVLIIRRSNCINTSSGTISVCKRLLGMPDRHTKQSRTQTNYTRWCINTIRSPDDHCDARNI